MATGEVLIAVSVSVVWWVLFTAFYFRKELVTMLGKNKAATVEPVAINVMGTATTPLPTTPTDTEEEEELDVEIEYEDSELPPSDELPDLEAGFEAGDDEVIDDSVTPPEVEHMVKTVHAPPTSVEDERKAAQTAKKIQDTDFFEKLQSVWGAPASQRVAEAVAEWEKELQAIRKGSSDSEEEVKQPNPKREKNEVPDDFDIKNYL